jgi:hypothetical protein
MRVAWEIASPDEWQRRARQKILKKEKRQTGLRQSGKLELLVA